jgi:hypothetical protein
MSFEKFFSSISDLFLGPPDAALDEAIDKLDPDKIYVENIRSLLGVSTYSARAICETAVRQGVFQKHVEVVCPDGSIAASAISEASLPPTVRCWQIDGIDSSEVEMDTKTLNKQIFYALNG